jgi:hypothetical protein
VGEVATYGEEMEVAACLSYLRGGCTIYDLCKLLYLSIEAIVGLMKE